MSYLIKLIQVLYSIYALAIFLLIMFLLFPFVLLTALFPKDKRGNMIYKIVTFWADLAMFLWGMYHKNFYEKPHDPSHPVIFVFNHISYVDIPVLLKAFRHQHIRVLGKAEMSKIPIFGYIYKSAAILVDRSNADARARSVKELKAAVNNNISVVIAPEGTFNMTNKPLKDFYDGAFRIAIETKTPIKPVIFLDAYNRLHYNSIFTLTPGRSRAVYLEQVGVDGLTADDAESLKRKVYHIMEAALIKYKADWIRS